MVDDCVIESLSSLKRIAERFSRSVERVNEELSIVGISVHEEISFRSDRGDAECRCLLTCGGEAAPRDNRALLIFSQGHCRAYTDGKDCREAIELASLSALEDADIYDFLLAVIEALAVRGKALPR